MNSSALKKAFWIFGAVMLGIGAIGWADRLFNGHIHAHYGNIVPWGLWVAAYLFLTGVSAGAYMVGSGAIVFRIRRFEPIALISTFTAFVSLIMALLLIWADLGRMGRAAYVMFFANLKSPMAWMIWFYSGFLFVVTLQLLVLLRGELDILKKIAPAWQPGANLIRRLAIVGFVLAIIFPTAVGVLFGVLAARPHWHSALIPILFLLSSIVSGCAALCVVLSIFQDGWRANRDLVVTLARIIRENEDAEAHFCYKHGV